MVNESDTRPGAVIGMDLGGTKLSGALFSREGEMIQRSVAMVEGKAGAEVGDLVLQQMLDLESYAGERQFAITSVGICVPGISNQNKRTVWAPNIPGWEAYPLHKRLKEGLRNPEVPLAIESDRNCYILGEMWKGNAQDCSNAIFMAIGTGIGIGVVANGQIINGAEGIAGAIGWMALDRPYSKDYDPCGQFEYYASGTGIARHAEELLSRGMESKHLHPGKITTRNVFDAYAKKDPLALQVLERSIEYWGMAVANLVSLLNPEKIIFGGGVFGPALKFLDRIYEEALKWAQPISIRQVKLQGSSLRGDTGLYGAGYMAMRNAYKF
jgi:glucokinase